MLRISLFVCCWLLIQTALGQQILKGRVFENKTRIPLADIKIQNTTNKQFTETDSTGYFKISAAANHMLVLNGFAYQADTIILTNLKEIEIFMEPQKTMLNEVKVTTPQAVGSFHFYDPDFHGQTVTKLRGGGIAIRISAWKKDEHKRERDAQLEIDDKTQLELTKTFAPANLAKYLPLKDTELVNFSAMYRPTPAVTRAGNFNLVLYLNDCYKKFMNLPPAKRIPEKLFP